MSDPKKCQKCGEIFYPDQHWKTLCIPCYKVSKRQESNSELEALREENFNLRFQLAIAAHTHCTIPPDTLRALIRLAHPDKHGGSQAANDATAWLLSQRGTA